MEKVEGNQGTASRAHDIFRGKCFNFIYNWKEKKRIYSNMDDIHICTNTIIKYRFPNFFLGGRDSQRQNCQRPTEVIRSLPKGSDFIGLASCWVPSPCRGPDALQGCVK